jgi:hypothetical protein
MNLTVDGDTRRSSGLPSPSLLYFTGLGFVLVR